MRSCKKLVPVALLLLGGAPLAAGSFNFPSANTSFFADSVVHPEVYSSGVGGTLQFRGCIDPASPFFTVMQNPTERAFETWNALVPTTENIIADLPDPPSFDYSGRVTTSSLLTTNRGE